MVTMAAKYNSLPPSAPQYNDTPLASRLPPARWLPCIVRIATVSPLEWADLLIMKELIVLDYLARYRRHVVAESAHSPHCIKLTFSVSISPSVHQARLQFIKWRYFYVFFG